MYRFLKPALIFLLLIGCAPLSKTEPRMLFLDYGDFGPQAMAYELIGMEWWQPDVSGQPVPILYDIKVIVYRGFALEEVKARYPVKHANAVDYRYVTYADATVFLDRHIDEDVLPEITSVLRNTKARLTETF